MSLKLKIKNRSLVFIIVFFVSTGLTSAQKFGFSTHAGLGLSQIGGDFLSGFNNIAYQIGINAPYKFSDRFEWVTGFAFKSNGSNKNGESKPLAVNRAQIEMQLRSISISGLVQFNFTENWEGGYKNYFRLGPSFNQIVSKNIKSISSKEVAEIVPVFRKSYINMNGIVGKNISDKYSLEFCFSFAVTSIKKAPENLAELYPYEIMVNFEYRLFN